MPTEINIVMPVIDVKQIVTYSFGEYFSQRFERKLKKNGDQIFTDRNIGICFSYYRTNEKVRGTAKKISIMKYFFCSIFTLLFFSSFLFGCKNEASTKRTTVRDSGFVNESDANLLSSAYKTSLYLLQLAKEGIRRSTSTETKTLADSVHFLNTKIAGQLNEIAGKKRVELPLDMDSLQLQKWRELAKEKGWEFDKKFIQLIIQSNKNSKSLYSSIYKSTKDADIKKAAQNILSHLDNYYSLALQTKDTVEHRLEKDTLFKPA